MDLGGPDRLLTRISTRAVADLEQHRGAATFWRLVDVFLLVPAAVAAAAAALLGPTGVIETRMAVGAALAAAALAGASVVFDIPARARRAQVAAIYLESFVAETENVADSGEAAIDLRRWFVRINAAITMGALDVDPELLGPSCAPGSGHCPPPENGNGGGSSTPNGEARPANGAGTAATGPARGTGRNRRSGPAGDAHGEAQGVRAAERAGVRHLPRLWWAFLLA
ncbi:MAG: hypothetical protein ACRD0C_22080, partial [Acidimicrobiia bacterium]